MPFDLHLGDPMVQRAAVTLLIVLVAFALAQISKRLVLRYVDDTTRRYRASKYIGRGFTVVTLLLITALWAPNLGGLLTILTIIGAGLAVATREVLLSFLGWMNIALRSPFKQGQRIEINGVRGDVVDIRLLHTTLMEIGNWVDADQSTGRLLHIPNAWIFQHAVQNYTHGFDFIWHEIPVTLTFRSDWEAAREIMLELAGESADIVERQAAQQLKRLSREYLVHYSILTPFVYVRVAENGVQLTLRYLCEVRRRRGTQHALTLGLLERFQEHGGIEMAYPTTGVQVMDTPQFGAGGPAFGNGNRPARTERDAQEPRRKRND